MDNFSSAVYYPFHINGISTRILMPIYKHQIYHHTMSLACLSTIPSLSIAVLNTVISLSNLGFIATSRFSSFTYLAMPIMSRLLRRWLYPKKYQKDYRQD
jgi:antibiotic biosynthesis monooxygenase (ABM) superfamily enzyme